MLICSSLKPPRLDDAREEDEKGILESVNKVHALVAEEAKHVPSERIVVGGFSQGAALSLLVSLTTEKKVRSFSELVYRNVCSLSKNTTDCRSRQFVRVLAFRQESGRGELHNISCQSIHSTKTMLSQIRKPDTQDTKIFMAHGTFDQVLQ